MFIVVVVRLALVLVLSLALLVDLLLALRGVLRLALGSCTASHNAKKKGELLKFTFTLYGTHIILSSCAVRLCVLLLEVALELVQFNKDKENDEADPASITFSSLWQYCSSQIYLGCSLQSLV